MTKIIVGTGWWCSGENTEGFMGDNIIRSKNFFDLWYHLVMKYINPSKIIVVDSASPIKPNLNKKQNVEFVSLDRNYLHSRALSKGILKTKYAGWTRSVFLSACYAHMCDADYYIYVEQDCLIRGEGLLDAAISGGSSGIWLGNQHRNARNVAGALFSSNVVQTSLLIARSESIMRLANGSIVGPQSDGEFAPEKRLMGNCKPYDLIQIPYGRNRPLAWDVGPMYAQHMTAEEVIEFMIAEKLEFDEYFSPGLGNTQRTMD
jgi:hypothetical protein